MPHPVLQHRLPSEEGGVTFACPDFKNHEAVFGLLANALMDLIRKLEQQEASLLGKRKDDAVIGGGVVTPEEDASDKCLGENIAAVVSKVPAGMMSGEKKKGLGF